MTNLLCKVRFVVFSNIINYYRKETKPITLLHRHTLKEPESLRILVSGFANPYGVQYICFVDLFCEIKEKGSICIESEGFVYESRKLSFNQIL
jgi:hypothetical protein